VALLTALRQASDARANPQTANLVEALQQVLSQILARSAKAASGAAVEELLDTRLPVFIYFENYGTLESAIYRPRFLEDPISTQNLISRQQYTAEMKGVSSLSI
jgi:hypothetical protein